MATETKAMRAQRKAGGVFYTPEHIVEFVVSETLDPLFGQCLLEKATTFKVVDPSCGAGAFLLAGYEYLLNWHLQRYLQSEEDVKRRVLERAAHQWRLSLVERQRILLSSIFGVDIDASAAEMARKNLLGAMLSGHDSSTDIEQDTLARLSLNIRCGDSIISRKKNSFDWRRVMQPLAGSGFNAVIGNPPYGARLTTFEKKYILENYRCGMSDTAAAFVERGVECLAPDGRLGFVVPKAFLYASNWARLRERHLQRIDSVTDLGKGWRDVKLEQCAVVLSKRNAASTYACFIRREHEFLEIGSISKTLAEDFGFILHSVSAGELKLAQRLRSECESLSGRCVNQRGAMLQKLIRKRGDAIAVGGRQIQRWKVQPMPTRCLDSQKIRDEKARVSRNSVLVQNIVAHIEHPVDHIKITAAVAPEESRHLRLLDTVNQLRCRNAEDARLICALLNSKLMNWYAYRFVFGKAVRTMHFDATATDRLPLPKQNGRNSKISEQISDIVLRLQSLNEKGAGLTALESQLNDLVFELYGLSPDERATVNCAMP